MTGVPGCRCSHPLVFVDEPEHCARCGHGPVPPPISAKTGRLRRLPRDLGALQREGRRPDPSLENVVRLDRLRRALGNVSDLREAA